jgi:ribosome-binding protein aMBF1 (putative translation factor)
VISNEFQYQNTQRLLAEFEGLAESLQCTADQAPRPKLRAIEIAAAESQAESLRTEIAEYEHLRSGAVTTITASTVLGIAELLIKARIARGWSQTQLAAALGMAVQQIQRYEATNYASASLARLSDIATALNIEINETAHIRRTA